MRRLLLLYRSLVGKKAIVAVTGVIWLGFLLFHVLGNLKAFLPDPRPGIPDIDVYSQFLRSMGEPLLPHSVALWLLRGVLVLALVLHVICVAQLAMRNRDARPVRYGRVAYAEATASARGMLYTGVLVLLFVVVHVLHLTVGSLDPTRFVDGAVYRNLSLAFAQWRFIALYLVAMVVLGTHLYHGAWSLFQTLGFDNPDRNRGLRRLAMGIALGVPLALASIPIAFFSGVMAPPPARTGPVDGSH